MINLDKINEKYMWKATFEDGSVIDEFIDESHSFTDFDKVNNKDNLSKFELVGQPMVLSFNKDGIFKLGSKEIKFVITDKESNEILDSSVKNLIMFRTNWQDAENGTDIVAVYTFGYKLENDNLFTRFKFFTGIEGHGFVIEITGKNDSTINFKMIGDNKVLDTRDIEIKKNTTTKIQI